MKIKRFACLLLCGALLCASALAQEDFEETDGSEIYTMVNEKGAHLAVRAARMYEGDELITEDNTEYVVYSVDDDRRIAYARIQEPTGENIAVSAAIKDDEKKLICMYCTHSDESYEPSDGEYSLAQNAGIYDVSEAFQESLETLGITVERSEETFLPHDAGAYRRSRSQTAEYVKMAPDAIFDIHRDGIPDPEEYEEKVDGEEIAQVRLLVGRSNANAEVNKSFAKALKASADQQYPGLIRDIYIGKGNYNQELYPKALLLEFGTYSNDKERVLRSTDMMAQVVSSTLYGSGQSSDQQETEKEETNAKALRSTAILIGIVLAVALIYGLASTGSVRNLGRKIADGAGELTGGALGGHPEKDKED